MATTHVFIVDVNTFKFHIEYMFAGTGAGFNNQKDKPPPSIDFNNSDSTTMHFSTERNICGMISDINRVRKGDFIIFYLQQNKQATEGLFFGIFVVDSIGFLDDTDVDQYLQNKFDKNLNFRVNISPHEVYAEGVTEWEALDEIKNLSSPNQMIWSLIYRKLKANRGNTMITTYEAERMFYILRQKNNHIKLNNKEDIEFCLKEGKIKNLQGSKSSYTGRQSKINILPRLLSKYKKQQAFETHLQAYILQNIGTGNNASLDSEILENKSLEWIGNEVSCGVGMQSIDILLSLADGMQTDTVIVELKSVRGHVDNIKQIERYINWVEQYYIPNKPSNIKAILITEKGNATNKKGCNEEDMQVAFNNFKSTYNARVKSIKHIVYSIENSKLKFEQVIYK